MVIFEYLVESLSVFGGTSIWQERLTALGLEGWELVNDHIVRDTSEFGTRLSIDGTFKRPAVV